MKILFIGDYSNLHTTLARELNNLGHHADILSDGCGYMKLRSDFFIKREKGLKGSFKYLYDLFNLLPKLRDYDVVQLINSNFLHLKPQKIKYFYDRIKEQNRSMFLTLAGNDYFYVKACFDAKLFRFSEFKIGNQFTEGCKVQPEHMYGWISNPNKLWAEYLFNDITGAMAVLPEYDMVAKPLLGDRVEFTNLPIDLTEIPPAHNFSDGKVKIFLGQRSGVEHWKGTNFLAKLAKEIESELPHLVTTEIVRDISLNQFLSKMANADIVLDQLFAYSPAMTALYAMAMGKVAASGAQPEYYQYIGNPEKRPIFPLSPLDNKIKENLIKLIKDKDEILRMGEDAKEIIKLNNDSHIVAKKFLNHWERLLPSE